MSSIKRSGDDGPRSQLVSLVHHSTVQRVAYLPDRRVVSCSQDRTMKVWNLENRVQEGATMYAGEVEDLAVTRNGINIISGDASGRVKVWDVDVESHELVREWTHEGACLAVTISPDDRFIAVGGRNVGIYTMKGRQVNSIELDEPVWSISFSPDGKKLACGILLNIYVYDVDNGTLMHGPLKGHEKWVCSVLWSRDGSRLFSASWDKTICCWNSDTGEQVGQLWTGHTHWIQSLSLSPDGLILASASFDKTVHFWDAVSGQPIRKHLQHNDGVTAVCFSPSGEFMASSTCHGMMYLWQVSQLDFLEIVGN